MAFTAPFPLPTVVGTKLDTPTKDNLPSDNMSDISSESPEGLESSNDETELMRLLHELKDVGDSIASPKKYLGDDIVHYFHVHMVNNVAVEPAVAFINIIWEYKGHIAVDIVIHITATVWSDWKQCYCAKINICVFVCTLS